MSSPEPGPLRELALAAADDHDCQINNEAAALSIQDARRLAKSLSDMTGQAIYGHRLPIEVDDLRFMPIAYDGITYPQLVGACPDCGQETLSGAIFHLWQLGEQVREFRPSRHGCQGGATRRVPDTLEGRLAAVLRDLVDERVDHILSTRGSDA